MYTIWRRVKSKAPWQLLAADENERMIRRRYHVLLASYKSGELKLAQDMVVVQRDAVERQVAVSAR